MDDTMENIAATPAFEESPPGRALPAASEPFAKILAKRKPHAVSWSRAMLVCPNFIGAFGKR